MRFPIAPASDERLQLAQYKAGYHAFFTAFIVLLHMGIAWVVFPSYITTAVIYFAIFIPSTAVFLFHVARAGGFTYLREHANASRQNRLFAYTVFAVQVFFFTTAMGVLHYYIPLSEQQPTVQESAAFAAIAGLFWSIGVGALTVFQLRKRAEQEEEE